LTIIVDTSFVKVYDIVAKSAISYDIKYVIFSTNTATSLIAQIIMLFYLNKFYREERFKNLSANFKKYSYLAMFVVLLNSALLSYTSAQLFQQHLYSKYILVYSIILCYISSGIFLAVLGAKFLSWYRRNHSYLILLYFVSVALIVFNILTSMLITIVKLEDKSDQIREYIGITSFPDSPKYNVLELINKISLIMTFVSLWITTFVLVTSYRKKSLRNFLFLMILILPLSYFFINFVIQYYVFDVFNYFHMVSPVVISIVLVAVFSLSNPIGGITFGILFWRTSKAISYEKDIVGFVLISGYGIMMIFMSNQVTSLSITPYPPFGLTTISLLPLSSYLMLVGIYNATKLVSSNRELRRSIIRIAKESTILNQMGEAENQKEVEFVISKIHEDSIVTNLETDIKHGADLDENELRKYIEEVVKELHTENPNA
jgi:MFS family permease